MSSRNGVFRSQSPGKWQNGPRASGAQGFQRQKGRGAHAAAGAEPSELERCMKLERRAAEGRRGVDPRRSVRGESPSSHLALDIESGWGAAEVRPNDRALVESRSWRRALAGPDVVEEGRQQRFADRLPAHRQRSAGGTSATNDLGETRPPRRRREYRTTKQYGREPRRELNGAGKCRSRRPPRREAVSLSRFGIVLPKRVNGTSDIQKLRGR